MQISCKLCFLLIPVTPTLKVYVQVQTNALPGADRRLGESSISSSRLLVLPYLSHPSPSVYYNYSGRQCCGEYRFCLSITTIWVAIGYSRIKPEFPIARASDKFREDLTMSLREEPLGMCSNRQGANTYETQSSVGICPGFFFVFEYGGVHLSSFLGVLSTLKWLLYSSINRAFHF